MKITSSFLLLTLSVALMVEDVFLMPTHLMKRTTDNELICFGDMKRSFAGLVDEYHSFLVAAQVHLDKNVHVITKLRERVGEDKDLKFSLQDYVRHLDDTTKKEMTKFANIQFSSIETLVKDRQTLATQHAHQFLDLSHFHPLKEAMPNILLHYTSEWTVDVARMAKITRMDLVLIEHYIRTHDCPTATDIALGNLKDMSTVMFNTFKKLATAFHPDLTYDAWMQKLMEAKHAIEDAEGRLAVMVDVHGQMKEERRKLVKSDKPAQPKQPLSEAKLPETEIKQGAVAAKQPENDDDADFFSAISEEDAAEIAAAARALPVESLASSSRQGSTSGPLSCGGRTFYANRGPWSFADIDIMTYSSANAPETLEKMVELESIFDSKEFFGVAKDGNCLYRAIALSMGIPDEECHMTLRQLAVEKLGDWLLAAPSADEHSGAFFPRESIESYIATQGRNSVYGEIYSIYALSHALGRDFTIWRNTRPEYVTVNTKQHSNLRPPILLKQTDAHYDVYLDL